MSDEEAIIYLSQLRQIGRWSAEMILLFTYNRSNIWPNTRHRFIKSYFQ